MRAIITVLGSDKVGIIAGVSTILAQANINILDITQTTMQGIFTMIMLVDISQADINFDQIRSRLDAKGVELGMKIHVQHEDIFKSMHEV